MASKAVTKNGMAGLPFLTLMLGVLMRLCVSLHHYSGERQPPMFGDYEAQRHWMEITTNLPLQEWYYNTTENDLLYWGLDYPPLTAYHSLLCGYVASFINPDFITLGVSRGYESTEHKFFMRSTVLIADLFVYIPAIWWFFCKTKQYTKGNDSKKREISEVQTSEEANELPVKLMFLALIYPGLILIDHGHFQYNGISLGLMVAAVAALCEGRDLIGSVLFTLSLNYKQMELYHALPFFCYLLGNCFPKENQSLTACCRRFLSLGFIVIITFIAVWFPFFRDINVVLQVVHRLFPLARGVFEDKVSNIWCCINVFYKFKNTFTNVQMAKLCLIATLLAVLPTSIDMVRRPKINKLVISLINSSLAFFLFSFQVHEKSILLAAIPVALYFPLDPFPCFWFLFISTFSMLPLILKDGLLIPYISLTIFYCFSVYASVDVRSKTLSPLQGNRVRESTEKSTETHFLKKCVTLLFYASLLGCVLLTVGSVVLKPPARYPDLFPLLISVYSCVHFMAFFIYFSYRQIFTMNKCVKSKYK